MAEQVTKAINDVSRCQRHLSRFAQRATTILDEDVPQSDETIAIESLIEKIRSVKICVSEELVTMNQSLEKLNEVMSANEDVVQEEQRQAFEEFDNGVLDVRELVSRLAARVARLTSIKESATMPRLDRVAAYSRQDVNSIVNLNSNPPTPDPQPSTQFPPVPRAEARATSHPSAVPREDLKTASTQEEHPLSRAATTTPALHRELAASVPVNQLTLTDLADIFSRIPTSAGPTSQAERGFGYNIPKFTLPSFDGKPEEWKPFWDRFERAIDRNTTIAEADKLSYLMSYLKGEAQMLVNDMPLTNDNYHVAIRQLQENFGDPKIAIEKVRQKLRDLPLVSSNNYQKFKEFFFVFEQLAKRLEHLGGDVNNEHLVDIILDKMPRFISDKVERAKDDDDDWTMSRLRNLLAKELKTEGKTERRMERRTVLLKSTQPSHDEKYEQRRNLQRRGTTEAFASSEQSRAFRNVPKTNERSNHAASSGYNDKSPTNPCLFCNGPHWMNECSKFATARQRWDKVKSLRMCFICLQKDHLAKNCNSQRPCFHCRQVKRHHNSMCPTRYPDRRRADEHGHAGDEGAVRDLTKPDDYGALGDDEQTVMKTVQMVAINPANKAQRIKIRAYLDNGTSRTFLSERAAEALQLPMGPKQQLRIKRFGNEVKPHTISYRPATLKLKGSTGETMKISVAVTSQTMTSINKVAVPIEVTRSIPAGIILADDPVSVNTQLQVDMMLGNDYYDDVVTGRKMQLMPGFWLLDSDFGWIVSGRISDDASGCQHIKDMSSKELGMQVIVDNDKVQSFADHAFISTDIPGSIDDLWKLETIGINDDEKAQLSDDDALSQFNKTVKFEDGHYQVTFPWNSNESELPSNRTLAERRLCSLVQRMQRQGRHGFLERYDKIIKDQMQKSVIEAVPDERTTNKVHYLPHHGVETPQKTTTKLRIVYDASAKESLDVPSLNDCIHRGHVFLENLIALLMRFRFHRIAIIADLEKAFLQVGLQSQDRDVTRFLWIKDIRKPPTPENTMCCRFTRVLFGAKSSPFLLGATVAHHLASHSSTVAKQIDENIYSDNVITGVNEISEAVNFHKESKQIFVEAGMNLREYASNSAEFMSHMPESDRVHDDIVKVLGIRWQRSTDQMFLNVPEVLPDNVSKKEMLSKLFQVYDPLGFVCPITIRGKILLQTICKKKLPWNQPLPKEDGEKWQSIAKDLTKIKDIRIPRYVGFTPSEASRLMCFVDASENAYAVVIYVQDCQSKGQLVFAKARVSPLKKKTIPRLELMAMLIGVRSINFVRRKLAFKGQIVLWSDSQCVLRWLLTKRVEGTFVRNRLNEIRKETDIEFRYVPSKQNPADLASRGIAIEDLNEFWWHGPHWMIFNKDQWPTWEDNPLKLQPVPPADNPDEIAMKATEATEHPGVMDINLDNVSTFQKAVRVTAWNLRFINNARHRSHRQPSSCLQPEEIRRATLLWIKTIQRKEFADVRKALHQRKRHTTIEQLGVAVDKDGVLRCHGRLAKMNEDDDTKYPILLPSKSRMTDLIIEECHAKVMHAKTAQTLANIRHKFWIPRGRARVKSVISTCKVCRLHDGGPFKRPLMPDLPASRVTRSEPFQHIGLDYFGPLFTRQHRNSREPSKRWICIFTCFTTRAIHLEVVNDLSSEEFLMGIRRFIARRSKPDTIISDNAPQFKAVKLSDAINRFSSEKAIKWTFIPEYAPWAGGIYERQIKNVKSAMRKTVGKCLLNDTQLYTIATEVEKTVNSRPITYIGDDPDDWTPLTPNDFLGIRQESFLPAEYDERDPDYRKGMSTRESICQLYRRHLNAMEEFWRIWENEYLLSLRERTHWKHKDFKKNLTSIPKAGQVVLIKDIGCPRNQWKTGRVVKACPSHDNAVRAVQVQLPSKRIVIRPVNFLHPLEMSREEEVPITKNIKDDADAVPKQAPGQRPRRKAAINARKLWQPRASDTSSSGSVTDDQI